MRKFTPLGLHLLILLLMACPSFHYVQNWKIHVFKSLQWLFYLHQWLQNAQISLGRLLFHPNWSKIDPPSLFPNISYKTSTKYGGLQLNRVKNGITSDIGGHSKLPLVKVTITFNFKVRGGGGHMPTPLIPMVTFKLERNPLRMLW